MAALIEALNVQIDVLAAEVEQLFDQHAAAVIYRSQPGVASKLGPPLLGEFGEDPHRYVSAKARKSYAGTGPITRQSGRERATQTTSPARYVSSSSASSSTPSSSSSSAAGGTRTAVTHHARTVEAM